MHGQTALETEYSTEYLLSTLLDQIASPTILSIPLTSIIAATNEISQLNSIVTATLTHEQLAIPTAFLPTTIIEMQTQLATESETVPVPSSSEHIVTVTATVTETQTPIVIAIDLPFWPTVLPSPLYTTVLVPTTIPLSPCATVTITYHYSHLSPLATTVIDVATLDVLQTVTTQEMVETVAPEIWATTITDAGNVETMTSDSIEATLTSLPFICPTQFTVPSTNKTYTIVSKPSRHCSLTNIESAQEAYEVSLQLCQPCFVQSWQTNHYDESCLAIQTGGSGAIVVPVNGCDAKLDSLCS